jgi:membrane protein YqaA with SNARE-associated domain
MNHEAQFERSQIWAKNLSRIWLGAFWGLAEATVFFLVPDILLTAAALFSPKKSFLQTMAVLIGTLMGGALMYTTADRYPDQARSVVLSVPFINQSLLEQAERQMQERGLWAMCIGAFSGIPYKTYAIAAPRHASFDAFMAVSAAARLARFLAGWAIASLLGMLFRRQIDANPTAALALLIVCWIGFYTYYWSTM